MNYAEGASSVELTDIVVSDADNGETVLITLTLDDPSLGSVSTNGFGELYDSETGIWTIDATVSAANNALAQVEFIPVTDNDLDTTISISIADGGEDSTAELSGLISLHPIAENDPPTITGTDPDQSTDDKSTISPFTSVIITDVDSPIQSLLVTVQVDSNRGTIHGEFSHQHGVRR